jgi:hypothetical protein
MRFASRLGVAGIAAVVVLSGSTRTLAQTPVEEGGGRVQLQVFDPLIGVWTSTVSALPGSRVEWRVVVSYVGTNTAVSALGGLRYQVVASNADNSGASLDAFAAWRNGGQQGNSIAGSMLSAAEGENGQALASYGRVRYGSTTMGTTTQTTITTWRHGGDFPRPVTPPGSWLRIAGERESTWPQRPYPYDTPVGTFLNGGLLANQTSAVNSLTGAINTFHVGGTQQLVVFRGAVLLSGDADRAGNMTLDIPEASLFGGPSITPGDVPVEPPPSPYSMAWQISSTDNGSWRSGVVIEPATIIIPAPGVLVLGGAVCGLAMRRRRGTRRQA